MITLEAMAMAKPIIATNIDGIIEQLNHGETGILVPPKNPEKIACETLRILENKNQAKEMGTRARKRVKEDFSVENMIIETENVYRSIINSS